MFFYSVEKIDASSLSKNEAREQQSKCGYELLKALLSTHFGIEEYKIIKNEYGKPFLENEGVFFSIAHSLDYVCCVVADAPVGIDIEATLPMSSEKAEALAKRFFAEGEIEYLRKRAFSFIDFYFLWTRKEALSKCKGTNLMPNLSIDILQSDAIRTEITDKYVLSIAINI